MDSTITSFDSQKPLADLLRPTSFSDYVGQEHILSEGKLLRRSIEADKLPSMILWGPPGCGKTTLAKIIAKKTKANFFQLSAVSASKAEAKQIIAEAEINLTTNNQKSVLFVDEIHRFNKSQQDIFLPYIENGVIIFIGATTENPSFEVNSPLLSRCRVFHLRELTETNIVTLLDRAVTKVNQGLIFKTPLNAKVKVTKEAKAHIAKLCEGDARDAYNALEIAILSTRAKNKQLLIDITTAEEAIQQKFIRYDKGADGHFDAISALHKSIRASDVDAALHYLARMIEAGEDPLYVVRRLIRFASEDIGMADPNALLQAVACQQAVHFVGMPEANVILAQCVIYLSLAPKSRSVDSAYASASEDIKNMRVDPIPLDIRNAPTKMMRDFGFGKGYQMYDSKSHLPENLRGKKYWQD
ncbi:MAG: Replication-associated recombination protein A [bacterium ADurb.Bin212]|nr:MAG: Replication-associated recombination protein A [bacterium ADurb.Bin212]